LRHGSIVAATTTRRVERGIYEGGSGVSTSWWAHGVARTVATAIPRGPCAGRSVRPGAHTRVWPRVQLRSRQRSLVSIPA